MSSNSNSTTASVPTTVMMVASTLASTVAGPMGTGNTSTMPTTGIPTTTPLDPHNNGTLANSTDGHAQDDDGCSICYLFVFFVLCIASFELSKFLSHFKMITITGSLLVGILAGPYLLGIFNEEENNKLQWVDRLGMGLIALTAGAEFYWRRIAGSHGKALKIIVFWLFAAGAPVYFIVAYFTSPLADFLDLLSSREKVILAAGGAILSLGGSSLATIETLNKYKGKGPFAAVALETSIAREVVVIVLFSVLLDITFAVLTDDGRPHNGLMFLIAAGDLLLSIVIGILLSPLLYLLVQSTGDGPERIATQFLFRGPLRTFLYDRFLAGTWIRFKACVLFAAAYGIHALEIELRGHSVFIQFAVVCLVAPLVLVNYLNSNEFTEKLIELIHSVAPLVYTAFFTHIGLSFDFSLIGEVWLVGLILFLTRLVALVVNGYIGTVRAGIKRRRAKFAFMAFILQAGVSMAYARAIEYDFEGEPWAKPLSTLIVFTIFLAQIIGPRTLRFGLIYFGDAKKKEIKIREADDDYSDSESEDEEDLPFDPRFYFQGMDNPFKTWKRSDFQLLNSHVNKKTTFPSTRDEEPTTVTIHRTTQRPQQEKARPDVRDIFAAPQEKKSDHDEDPAESAARSFEPASISDRTTKQLEQAVIPEDELIEESTVYKHDDKVEHIKVIRHIKYTRPSSGSSSQNKLSESTPSSSHLPVSRSFLLDASRGHVHATQTLPTRPRSILRNTSLNDLSKNRRHVKFMFGPVDEEDADAREDPVAVVADGAVELPRAHASAPNSPPSQRKRPRFFVPTPADEPGLEDRAKLNAALQQASTMVPFPTIEEVDAQPGQQKPDVTAVSKADDSESSDEDDDDFAVEPSKDISVGTIGAHKTPAPEQEKQEGNGNVDDDSSSDDSDDDFQVQTSETIIEPGMSTNTNSNASQAHQLSESETSAAHEHTAAVANHSDNDDDDDDDDDVNDDEDDDDFLVMSLSENTAIPRSSEGKQVVHDGITFSPSDSQADADDSQPLFKNNGDDEYISIV